MPEAYSNLCQISKMMRYARVLLLNVIIRIIKANKLSINFFFDYNDVRALEVFK